MPRMGDATRNALISGVWAVFALHPSRIAPVTGHATVKETLCGPFADPSEPLPQPGLGLRVAVASAHRVVAQAHRSRVRVMAPWPRPLEPRARRSLKAA